MAPGFFFSLDLDTHLQFFFSHLVHLNFWFDERFETIPSLFAPVNVVAAIFAELLIFPLEKKNCIFTANKVENPPPPLHLLV